MYCIEICCVCISRKDNLRLLLDNNSNLLHKLTYCVPELSFEFYTPRYICLKCCEQLESVLVFKAMCIRNQRIVQCYLSELENSSELTTDQTICVKNERFVENYLSDLQKTGEITAQQYTILRVAQVRIENDTVPIEYTQPTEIKCEVTNDSESKPFLKNTTANFDRMCVNEEEQSVKTETEDNSDVMWLQIKQEHDYGLHTEMDIKEECEESTSVANTAMGEENSDMHYKCQQCGKYFNTPQFECDHSEIKKRKNKYVYHTVERKFECEVYGKVYRGASTLQIHSRTHTGEKPYNCKTCGKSFTRKDILKLHEKVHSGDRQYICDVCGKAFVQSNDLRKHKFVHSGEKPYDCDTCGKAFNRIASLKTHQLVHTKNRKFCCNICGKTFTHPKSLKFHQNLHKDKRNFKCSLCDNAFFNFYQLKIHILKHTGERPYKCDVCNKTFRYLTNLRRHQVVHKNKK